MPRFLSIVFFVTAFAVSGGVAAQDASGDETSAEGHYQTAVRLFGEGRYGEALAEFDAAIAQSPESIFYCNRAIVLIKLQEPQSALESLETCQRTHAGGSAELAEIDAQRAAVQVLVGHITPSILDTVSSINAPLVAPNESRGWTRTSTGILFMGVGGAAIASAVTLDFLSQDIKMELKNRASEPVPAGSTYQAQLAEYEAVRKRYVTRQRIWLGLTAAGTVLTLTGATLVVSRWLSVEPKDVEIGFTPTHPGLALKLRW